MKKTYARSYSILWAGNDESFNTYMIAIEQSMQRDAKGFVSNNSETVEKEEPNRLLSVADGVGVIDIKGVLTNTDAWYNRYFGLVAYEEIVDALYQAALDPAVKEILMNVASPGGAINGVLDAVSAVAKVGKVKRITAFTSSAAASAAYWLIAPTKERYATATAITGSIGVVAKHVEFSKMNEMEGVTETIVRAGEFKQLANSSEPLSKKAEADLQAKVDYTYGIMLQSIADSLKTTPQVVDKQMGQGREFIGQQGVDHGLIDGVSSFEEVYAKIQTRIQKQSGGVDMSKKYGMAAALAAVSAGVEVSSGDVDPTEGAVTEGATDPPETPIADGTTLEGTASAAAAEEPSELDVTKAQLAEKEAELAGVQEKVQQLEAQIAELTSLKAVVAEVINNMTVALSGGSQEGLAEKDVAFLVSTYTATKEKTMEAFKAGGLARREVGEESSPAQSAESRMDAALRGVATIRVIK